MQQHVRLPVPPTAEQMAASRAEWVRDVRKHSVRLGSVAILTSFLIEFIGNAGLVNGVIRKATKGDVVALMSSTFSGWDATAGISTSDAVVIVTTLTVLAATITIALVAAPRAAEQRTLYDRVALGEWVRLGCRLPSWAIGVAMGCALTRLADSPAMAVTLGLFTIPSAGLAVMTVPRAEDQLATGLEVSELEQSRQSRLKLQELGPRYVKRQSKGDRTLWMLMLVASSTVAATTVILVLAWAALNFPVLTIGDVAYSAALSGTVNLMISILVIPALAGCRSWFWRANAQGRRFSSLGSIATAVVLATLWLTYLCVSARSAPALGNLPAWVGVGILAVWPILHYSMAVVLAARTGRGPGASSYWVAHEDICQGEERARLELARQAKKGANLS